MDDRHVDLGGGGPGCVQDRAVLAQQTPDVFAHVRTDGREYDALPLNVLEDKVLAHTLLGAQLPVLVSGCLEFKEPSLEGLLEQKLVVGVVCQLQFQVHLIAKHSVVKVKFSRLEVFILEYLLDPLDKRVETEDTGVRGGRGEVCVLNTVTSISQSQAHTVSRVLVNRVSQRQKVAGGLGHFLRVQEQVTVGPDALNPVGGRLGPHGHMVVKGIGQVVGHQILARHPNITGIPEFKFGPHLLQRSFGNLAVLRQRALQENIVPNLAGHVLNLDVEGVGLAGVVCSALEWNDGIDIWKLIYLSTVLDALNQEVLLCPL